MKLIYSHENIAVLHSVKNLLSLNDINSFIKNEHGAALSVQFGISNTFHELWIHDDKDYDRATNIIENELENPEPKKSWVCDKCSEENSGNFEVCWNCQNEPPDTLNTIQGS